MIAQELDPVVGTSAPEDLLNEVRHALEREQFNQLAELLTDQPVGVLTHVINRLEGRERFLVFRSLPRELESEVFSKLSFREQNRLLRQFTDGQTRDLIRNLDPDDRTELLEDLPAEVTQRLLNMLNPDQLFIARELLGYPEESVGRLMTPEFVTVRPGWTVNRVLDHLRNLGEEPETTRSIFVTYEDRLLDTLNLREILSADEDTTVEDLMDESVVQASPYLDREEAVAIMRDNDLYALPVVNDSGKLLGIVTLDDTMDVSRSEATEDFQRFGASEPLRRPYWDVSIPYLARKRMGWLLFLFVGGALTSAVIGAFEDTLAAVLMLSIFIPLLIGTGGNAGTQSVSTIIRAIALGEVTWSDSLRVIAREVLVGVLMGLAMGVVGFLFVYWYWQGTVAVSLVIGLTLPIIVVWSNMFAGFLPLLADRLNLDPTLMSAPLITTFVDATGLLIYFSIARAVLGI